jgi:hypothetical protein
MLTRSKAKVTGSRDAARYLHSDIGMARDNCTRASAAKAAEAAKPVNRQLTADEEVRAKTQIDGLFANTRTTLVPTVPSPTPPLPPHTASAVE